MTEMLQRARAFLDRVAAVRVAIVYGSFARNAQRPDSDFDVAVAAESRLSVTAKVRIVTGLSRLLGREVDLIDLNEASGTVLTEALSQGRLLLNRDPELLARILSKAMVQHEDFDKLRDKLMRDKRARVFNGKSS